MAAPAQRVLAAAGIQSLEQLAAFNEAEIKQLHGIGPMHSINFAALSMRKVYRLQKTRKIKGTEHEKNSGI